MQIIVLLLDLFGLGLLGLLTDWITLRYYLSLFCVVVFPSTVLFCAIQCHRGFYISDAILITVILVIMPNRCTAFGCKSGYDNHKPEDRITFHTYPRDQDLREKWISANPRKDFKPSNTATLCSLHFRDSDFVEKHSDSNLRRRRKYSSTKLERQFVFTHSGIGGDLEVLGVSSPYPFPHPSPSSPLPSPFLPSTTSPPFVPIPTLLCFPHPPFPTPLPHPPSSPSP